MTPPLVLTLRAYAQSAPSLMRPHLAAAADAVEECARLRADLAAARALLREVQAYVLPDDERARRLTDRIDAALKGDEK